MSIKWIKDGNILDSQAEMIVNPVNCVGVMGKGLAKQFKERFPSNFDSYKRACKAGDLVPGGIHLWDAGDAFGGDVIVVNLATKDHWKDPSRLEWIASGLRMLQREVIDECIELLAIPALGCGLGGLDWNDVKPLIEQYFGGDEVGTEIEVEVYEPH